MTLVSVLLLGAGLAGAQPAWMQCEKQCRLDASKRAEACRVKPTPACASTGKTTEACMKKCPQPPSAAAITACLKEPMAKRDACLKKPDADRTACFNAYVAAEQPCRLTGKPGKTKP